MPVRNLTWEHGGGTTGKTLEELQALSEGTEEAGAPAEQTNFVDTTEPVVGQEYLHKDYGIICVQKVTKSSIKAETLQGEKITVKRPDWPGCLAETCGEDGSDGSEESTESQEDAGGEEGTPDPVEGAGGGTEEDGSDGE